MIISPINNVVFNKNISFKGGIKALETKPVKSYNTLPAGLFGKTKVQIDAINKLKEETKEFPKDIEYRKQLLINSGLNPNEYYKLRPIVGMQEIQAIMKSYDGNEQFYNVGKDDRNIKSGFLRGNLHIHTQASDGALSIEELLDKAANYADSVIKKQPQFKKEPFTIAITDHDTTESAQKAIKIIAANPLKYKNLRVILGTEMTTFNDIAPNVLNTPSNTHVLAYGIDPNEKTYKNFIDGLKNKKLYVEKTMIKDANELYKEITGNENNIFNIEEAKNISNFLRKNILGTSKYLGNYLKLKYAVNDILYKNEEILSLIKTNKLGETPEDFIKGIAYKAKTENNNNRPVLLPDIATYIKDKTGFNVKNILEKEYERPEHKKAFYEINNYVCKYDINFAHTEKFHFMPTFEDLYKGLEAQPYSMIGLAHPLKNAFYIKEEKDRLKYLADFYKKFKTSCKEKAMFSEVYYQSYSKEASKSVKEFLNKLSATFKLFRTGSADTHGKNIFKRLAH